MKRIIGYEELQEALDHLNDAIEQEAFDKELPRKRTEIKEVINTLVNNLSLALQSHMSLQDRNEKLRIQNSKLIDIITSVKAKLKLA